MKKMNKYFLAGVLTLFFLGGAWFLASSHKEAKNMPHTPERISMIVKESTLTKTGATIVIKDFVADEKHTYGEYFRIERKENDVWTPLEPIIKDYGFNAIGYSVNENNQLELEVHWEWLYGELSQGTYRLIKDYAITKQDAYAGKKEIYTEFTISENSDIVMESLFLNADNKKITLDVYDAKQMIELLEKLSYAKETCDGLESYSIVYDNKKYGLEVFSNEYHITLSEKGEAILSTEEKAFIEKIIEKYF